MDYYQCRRNITMMSFWVFFASNIPIWILEKLVIQKQENCSFELKDRKGAIWKNGKLSTITTLLQPNTQEGKSKHKIFPFITHGGKILVGRLELHFGEAVRRYPNPSAKAVSKEAEQRVGKLPPPLQMVASPLPTTQTMNRDHMGRLNYYPHPPSHARRCGARGDQQRVRTVSISRQYPGHTLAMVSVVVTWGAAQGPLTSHGPGAQMHPNTSAISYC